MTIRAIEHAMEHRPWKLPNKKWKFYQEWNNAVFLHWKVSYENLKKLVPEGIEIDSINGNCWVSLVAFTMEKIRPRYLPSFPPVSNFDEINIRTYVKRNNKTGVYFLSIEGGKKTSCMVAKGISELPYRYSKIVRTNNNYKSKNLVFNDSMTLDYQIGKTIIQKPELDIWLTERYALFQDSGDCINEFEIHHLPWEVKTLEIDRLSLNYPRFKNLLNESPDIARYSPGVQVIAWDKVKSKK